MLISFQQQLRAIRLTLALQLPKTILYLQLQLEYMITCLDWTLTWERRVKSTKNYLTGYSISIGNQPP